jgi:hypothetical protein
MIETKYSGRANGVEDDITFYSWSDYLEFAEKRANHNGYKESSRRIENERNPWTGTATFQEALSLARDGWAEGDAIVNTLSSAMVERVTSLIEKDHIVYDVEGMGIDIAAYLKGEPECWMRQEKEWGSGEGTRHIKLVYNITVSGGVGTDIILARGAAVAALIQCLEYSGTRVELWVNSTNGVNDERNPDPWECNILVKASDQDLDMSRVTFALAHPGMFRRLIFAVMEGHEKLMGIAGMGYGRVSSTTKDKGDIYIDGAHLYDTRWTDTASSEKWVEEMLKKQGIKLGDHVA